MAQDVTQERRSEIAPHERARLRPRCGSRRLAQRSHRGSHARRRRGRAHAGRRSLMLFLGRHNAGTRGTLLPGVERNCAGGPTVFTTFARPRLRTWALWASDLGSSASHAPRREIGMMVELAAMRRCSRWRKRTGHLHLRANRLQLVRKAGEGRANRVVRDLASLLSSELKLDAPIAVDVRCREDRLQQRLGPPRVESLDVLEERSHAGGERADRLLALPLLREPAGELRLTHSQPSALIPPCHRAVLRRARRAVDEGSEGGIGTAHAYSCPRSLDSWQLARNNSSDSPSSS